MSRAYVVCAFCGARIRADRGRCLRCGEVLQAAAPAPAPLPSLREWLQRSNPRNLAIGAVASLAILIGAVLFMDRSSAPGKRGSAGPAAKPAEPSSTFGRSAPQGMQMSPATAADSVRLGNAVFTSGDFEAAKIQYQQALQKNANDLDALTGLALVLERQGQIGEALALFSRVAAASPSQWTHRFNLAHALGEGGQWDRAIDEYRAAAALFPDDYATQFNLASAMQTKGDHEGSIPEFRKAIALAPREPSFHRSLAVSLEKTGKVDEAQREYQQYLEMAPWAPDAEQLKAHLRALASGTPRAARTPSAP